MIEVGTILQNRYRIDKQIGQGGMGKVYVASDERFNSTVAIKETVFEDKNLRKAFEREARLLNSLKHQALPRVSDHFTEGDGQFLVMEYIAGEDLAEMMERRGESFSLDDVLGWAYQLCDALEYLHAQDIIHRDIKPQNLKLTPKGQIVLLDFGLAKGNAVEGHHTLAKSIFGYSRSYASLEQIQGTGTEPRSDLYSLAATIYHLLTGIPPVDALTRAMNVLNGKPDPLIPANLINQQVPRGVAEILQKTMALNASERPETAVSMKSILQDSDKTIDSNEAIPYLSTGFTADLLTQETKIKSATTSVPENDASELRTNVISDNATLDKSYKTRLVNQDDESKVTQIRPAASNTEAPKRKKAFAAVAGGLLLVGTAIGGLFLYDNSVDSQINSNNGTTNAETKSTFVITTNGNLSNQSLTNSNPDLINAEPNTKSADNLSAPKSVTSAKNKAKDAKSQSETAQATSKTVTAESKSETIIVNDNRIETENMIIDENGFKMKRKGAGAGGGYAPFQFPNANAKPPIIPPVGNYKVFTPEQIRELERIRNMKPRTVIVKPPPPKPTP
jgi:serine/threonine protein kinase